MSNTFNEDVNINITDEIFINTFLNNKSYTDKTVAKYLTYIVDLKVLELVFIKINSDKNSAITDLLKGVDVNKQEDAKQLHRPIFKMR